MGRRQDGQRRLTTGAGWAVRALLACRMLIAMPIGAERSSSLHRTRAFAPSQGNIATRCDKHQVERPDAVAKIYATREPMVRCTDQDR